jgi:rubrerythrin
MTTEAYTIEHTQDEYGEHHWYITDEHGDWIGDSYATRELAADVIARGAVPTVRYCTACSHFHEPDEPCRCPECGRPATTPGGTCDTPHAA